MARGVDTDSSPESRLKRREISSEKREVVEKEVDEFFSRLEHLVELDFFDELEPGELEMIFHDVGRINISFHLDEFKQDTGLEEDELIELWQSILQEKAATEAFQKLEAEITR